MWLCERGAKNTVPKPNAKAAHVVMRSSPTRPETGSLRQGVSLAGEDSAMSEPEPSPVEGTSFRFRLLGSFAVFRNGVPLDAPEIGSRKGRTLLKLLLLERRHIVGNDRIAEVLWSDPVPDNADRLVATLVSRLRSVLGPDSVEGGPGGYRFAPGAGFEVDLDDAERFVGEAEARMDAGEPSLSVTAAQRALGLFEEGALLEDEPYAEWAEQARADAGRVL